MLLVPFLSEVPVRGFQPIKELVGQVVSGASPPVLLPQVRSYFVHGDFPEPRAERPFPPSLEPRKLADYDEEYFLGQVGALVAQSGDAAEASDGSAGR